ncbi:NAD(P)-dependent dehydrogenase (short-subunit alcohol dehydrogenase family) [Jatrophihabitans sp. GAS493]|uniref:SDR family oxidoreductase n=1 Tax=Jatrophihabitans sp. GAS493 TaxID=1907575 RepID=UPI000BB6B4C4|nr:SDR family oxidoreductase [Jatrophihabitans sp. GAS493]SOD74615.1 NAD(P)-dependent dehydrogenase (short-subunit alcohol dehydrogenase family) [Jatrophihabitans sp. GAS493]
MDVTKFLPLDLFAGRVVFVTGGGSGINLGIASAFAALGADVAICGRSADRLAGAAEQLNGFGHRVLTQVADVRDAEQLAAALDASERSAGPADVVVCGAAGNFVAAAENLSPNGFRTVVDIDLLGSFNTSRAAFDQLRRTRGALLFVSAAQAYLPFAYQAHVGAAKAGVDSLMRNLALEWGRYGIRSNSIVPGPTAGTEGMRRLGDVAGEETWTSMVPLGRYAELEEIAAMAVVLCSPLAAYVTGAQVIVDGGQGLSGSALFNNAVGTALDKMPDAVPDRVPDAVPADAVSGTR